MSVSSSRRSSVSSTSSSESDGPDLCACGQEKRWQSKAAGAYMVNPKAFGVRCCRDWFAEEPNYCGDCACSNCAYYNAEEAKEAEPALAPPAPAPKPPAPAPKPPAPKPKRKSKALTAEQKAERAALEAVILAPADDPDAPKPPKPAPKPKAPAKPKAPKVKSDKPKKSIIQRWRALLKDGGDEKARGPKPGEDGINGILRKDDWVFYPAKGCVVDEAERTVWLVARVKHGDGMVIKGLKSCAPNETPDDWNFDDLDLTEILADWYGARSKGADTVKHPNRIAERLGAIVMNAGFKKLGTTQADGFGMLIKRGDDEAKPFYKLIAEAEKTETDEE